VVKLQRLFKGLQIIEFRLWYSDRNGADF